VSRTLANPVRRLRASSVGWRERRTTDDLVIEDTETGKRRRLDARALFVLIGAKPYTEWLNHRVALDDGGYVLTGQNGATSVTRMTDATGARRSPALLETSAPGVFAAGDVRSGSTQPVAAAVGDGAIAVRLVHQLLGGRRQLVRLAQTYVSAAAA
jgi:thioredoxin reductase (NADPH)